MAILIGIGIIIVTGLLTAFIVGSEGAGSDNVETNSTDWFEE